MKHIDEDGDELKEGLHLEKPRKKSSFSKYLSFATGFVYTIISPVVLLLGIYFGAEYVIGFQRNVGVIIFLIIFGLITGYWVLFKEIKAITAKGKKSENKNKKD